jgi:hypothetical protein
LAPCSPNLISNMAVVKLRCDYTIIKNFLQVTSGH